MPTHYLGWMFLSPASRPLLYCVHDRTVIAGHSQYCKNRDVTRSKSETIFRIIEPLIAWIGMQSKLTYIVELILYLSFIGSITCSVIYYFGMNKCRSISNLCVIKDCVSCMWCVCLVCMCMRVSCVCNVYITIH